MKNITKNLYASVVMLMMTMLSGTRMAAADTYDPYTGTGGGLMATLLTGACLLPAVIILIIDILILIWVYKDAKRRGASGALWVIIVLFTGIIGLIIWLIVRPPIPQQPVVINQYQQPPQQGYYQQPQYQQPPQPQQPNQQQPPQQGNYQQPNQQNNEPYRRQ